MKYTYTTTFAILTIVASGMIFTSCESDEKDAPDAVMEAMQFEAHFSHSTDLYNEGNSYHIQLRAELGALQATKQGDVYDSKIKALQMTLSPMDRIEGETETLLMFIHEQKKRILTNLQCAAALPPFERHKACPVQIDGSQIIDEIDDFYIPYDLHQKLLKYRNLVADQLANSHINRTGNNVQFVQAISSSALDKIVIKNNKSDAKRLRSVLSSANPDDLETLIELILEISPRKNESKVLSARNALHYLCIQESRILRARKLAYQAFKSRFSTCGIVFDRILPMVSGPTVIESGQEVELQLSVSAVDSYDNPEVTCDQNASIEVREGVAYLKVQLDKTTTLKGTISRRNKMGKLITQDWEKEVKVIK